MVEIIHITYEGDSVREGRLASRAKETLEAMGSTCFLHMTYCNENSIDGLSPRIEYPDGSILSGEQEIIESLGLEASKTDVY